ncbi:MAG: gamma-glutamyltransferase [Saprospirales bacterium]|nr:gamma-glutamyltransferase [Saprospirales bacterium]
MRLALLLLPFLLSCSPQISYTPQKTAYSTDDMIVAAHPLAVRAGHEIFRKGGNAVDAAIAAQFALAVVHPRAGNIGGGGFMVLRTVEGQYDALDYREKAPLAATETMYLDGQGRVIPELSLSGHRAVGVPGTVMGMYEAHRKYGRIKEFGDLLAPAIRLAKKGFPISQAEAGRLNEFRADFLRYNDTPNPFAIDKHWKSGDLLVQPELARTLERIRKSGPEEFYTGETAQMLLDEMARGGGLLSRQDLESYEAVWRNPVVGSYKNYRIISMPPPSSGGIALLQLLRILEHYPMKAGDPESMHLMIEAMRRVYADRAQYLGDPDFFEVPVDSLLDEGYLAGRMADFSADSATSSLHTGWGDFKVRLEHFETTHTSVVDAEGMAVSVTTTLNSNYGSKVVVGGAGFFLNNEMDDFSVKPGEPNQFGLVGGKANAIEPGKRMLSSMTPTIVEKDGQLFLLLGSPGGSTIITANLQVILNVIEFGMTLPDAVAAPRFHHQWLPDEVWVEKGRFDPILLEKLRSKGHTLVDKERLGIVKAIQILPDGRRCGAADFRNPDDHAQ